MNRTYIIVVSALLGFGLLCLFWINYVSSTDQVSTEIDTFEPYRATLEGKIVCLSDDNISNFEDDACVQGLQTNNGDLYGIDFMLMSKTPDPFPVGERIIASGLVTPVERLSAQIWHDIKVEGIFSVTSVEMESVSEDVGACDGDAKICWDGSSVGRQSPSCDFVACPSQNATSAVVTTYLEGDVTALNVTLSPREIISDSRCPIGVTCVWAGTVEVRTTMSTKVSHGEHIMRLNEPQIFGGYDVTLVEVTPSKKEVEISLSSYRFTYQIDKR